MTGAARAPARAADPRDRGGPRQPLLTVEGLRKWFPVRGPLGGVSGHVQAVDGIGFTVMKNETVGVVGESGCGKSTAARLIMHLIDRDAGTLVLDGDVVGPTGIGVRDLRRNVQMVFQDSYSSLNPRHTAVAEIAFGLRVAGASRREAQERARATLGLVGLDPGVFGGRYPHELSGGQRQRVNIARGLAVEPRMLILDEAVSALDKSVQAQVLNLLQELKARLNLAYLFISHDLNVVRFISDRILVMYLGKVVEFGAADDVWQRPAHPYTRALFASRLPARPGQRVAAAPLAGDPPNPVDPPPGCRFRPRCALAENVCAAQAPALLDVAERHAAACFANQPGSGHSLAGGLVDAA